MIAALPMYDRPELRDATDRFWRAIRAQLCYGPAGLTRDRDMWEVWQSPDLLLAQTCGFPYRERLQGRVQLLGTPDYGLEGCPPGYYRSAIVVRADSGLGEISDLSGRRMAFNDELSQSGWAAFRNDMPDGFELGPLVQSGSHAASAQMVADGAADFAAIDALTWRLLYRYEDFTQSLRVLGWTAPTPGLPYITSLSADADALFAAVSRAVDDLSIEDRDALCLRGLVRIPEADYLAVPIPPPPLAH